MPKLTFDCVCKFCKENRDIILPALGIFSCGLAIGLALRGASKGTSIKILATDGSNVTLDDVIVTGAYASNVALND